MDVFQCPTGFQFNEKPAIDQEVCDVGSNHLTFVSDRDRYLAFYSQPRLAQLQGQGIFVHLLEESRSKRIRDSEHTSDDHFRQWIMIGSFLVFHISVHHLESVFIGGCYPMDSSR